MKKLVDQLKKIIQDESYDTRLQGDDELIQEINKLLNHIESQKKIYIALEKNFQNELYRARQLNHVLCHDLLTPLAAAKTTYQMICISPEEKHPKLLQIVERSIDKSIILIDDVRNYLKVDEGKMDLTLLFEEVKSMIDESVELLDHRLQEKDIKLNIHVEPGIEVLVYRNSFIHSVMSNILSNAIKFSERSSEIRVIAESDDEMAVIKIRDFGIGMSKELRSKLFSISDATSRKGTEGELGTGFGMPIVKKFVEAFEGSIDVESWERNDHPDDHGTLVTLRLWKNLKIKKAI